MCVLFSFCRKGAGYFSSVGGVYDFFSFLYHFVRQVIHFFFLWAVSFAGSRILLPELMR